MAVKQYIGARYVPLIFGEWDSNTTYEPLSIVTNNGNSYTSKIKVPAGTPLSNTKYWCLTGNFNAQLQYVSNSLANIQEILKEMAEYPKYISDTMSLQFYNGKKCLNNITYDNNTSTLNINDKK